MNFHGWSYAILRFNQNTKILNKFYHLIVTAAPASKVGSNSSKFLIAFNDIRLKGISYARPLPAYKINKQTFKINFVLFYILILLFFVKLDSLGVAPYPFLEEHHLHKYFSRLFVLQAFCLWFQQATSALCHLLLYFVLFSFSSGGLKRRHRKCLFKIVSRYTQNANKGEFRRTQANP